MVNFKIFPGTFTHDGRKVPIKEVKWKEEATNDQNKINEWLRLYGHKIKFWGIPCGPENGILVLDVDVKENGLETVKKYPLPQTMSQTTRSGGKHYVFKYPQDGEQYGNKVGFDSGLDIRGAAGYIAHYDLDSTPIAEAPTWLMEQARTVKKEPVDLSKRVQISPEICRVTLLDACENIRNAPEGEGNDILNIEAYRIGQMIHSMDYDYTFNELLKAAKDRGRSDYEAKATITSGFKGGQTAPYTSPFENTPPQITTPIIEPETPKRWTPDFFTNFDLKNISKLRRPQIFKDWSTKDISITVADGGTGKTTLKLYESICLALGESFLGFDCLKEGGGRTLFITGEDTREKLGAVIGAICKQMGIDIDPEKMTKIKNNILVKKDSDLCLIDKTKQGFISINNEALNKVLEAVEDIKPDLIVFDPISSFWGSESALNDMSRTVAKFMNELVVASDACVEVINHSGKSSSKEKDMSQFAGRGGTGLPSHARVSRVLRPLFGDEYFELTGMELQDGESAMLCNVNKFSDGSPLYNKPFIIKRQGYLFSKVTLVEKKVKEQQEKMSDTERVFTFIKSEIQKGRQPNKNVITAYFKNQTEKLSRDKVNEALSLLEYSGHMGEKVKLVENPDIEVGGKVFIITDLEGKQTT